MPLWLATAFGSVTGFVKAHWEVIAIGLALAAMTATILVYGAQREQQGVTKTELKVEKDHTETIKVVRDDEHLAQSVANAVGAELSNKLDAQKTATDAKLKDINDALASLPATAPADRPAVLTRVRDNSNALVDRANGAATYAGPAD